jgi:hypothetical protein
VIKGNLMQENQRQLRLFPDQSVTQGLQLNKLELKTQGDIEYQRLEWVDGGDVTIWTM